MERATCRSVGISLAISSLRCEAFRAASNLVQVSQVYKTKHGRSPVACESNAVDLEMENGRGARALMAKGLLVESERRER